MSTLAAATLIVLALLRPDSLRGGWVDEYGDYAVKQRSPIAARDDNEADVGDTDAPRSESGGSGDADGSEGGSTTVLSASTDTDASTEAGASDDTVGDDRDETVSTDATHDLDHTGRADEASRW